MLDLRDQLKVDLRSFDPESIAIVIGSTGGIGSALYGTLSKADHFKAVHGFSRSDSMPVDILDEASIAQAVERAASQGDIRLVILATGFLHDATQKPEKTWRDISMAKLSKAFALNTIGPAIVLKYVLPKLPRTGKSVFAALSARVGSIADNQLGGWYAYRASKAAMNQVVRTASIELARRSPDAICVSLHPGTVETSLSNPYMGSRMTAHSPTESARHLIDVIERLAPEENGGFFDWKGNPVPY